MKFHLELVIWGESFVETFRRVCLPSLLWPGNLPSLTTGNDCRLSIYTTPEDELLIRRSMLFAKLEQLLPVNFIYLHTLGANSSGLQKALACLNHFTASEASRGAGLVFLCPDCIYADGSLARMAAHANDGRRIVFVSGLRTDKAGMYRTLGRYSDEDNTALEPVTPRELVRSCLKNLHPQQMLRFWDGPRILTDEFALLCWRVVDQGLVMRAFCLHPLLVVPTEPYHGLSVKHSLDYVYPPLIHARPEEVYIADDSDELFIVELSDRDLFDGQSTRSGSMEVNEVASWAEKVFGYLHFAQLKRTVRIHHSDLTDEWKPVESTADEIVDKILTLIGEPGQPVIGAASDRLSIFLPEPISAELLEESLSMTAPQLRRDDEILLPEEGWSDDCISFLRRLAGQYQQLKIRFVRSATRAPNIRDFFEQAAGEYILMLRNGSFPRPQALEKSLNLLRWYPNAAICCSDPVTIDAQAYLVHQHLGWKDLENLPISFDSFLSPVHFAKNLRDSPFDDSSCVIKRSVLLEPSMFDDRLAWFAWPFAVLKSAFHYGACFIPEPLFVCNDELLSWRISRQPHYARMAALEEVIRILSHPETRPELACFVLSRVIGDFQISFAELAYNDPTLWEIGAMLSVMPLCEPRTVAVKMEETTGSRKSRIGLRPMVQQQWLDYEGALQAENFLVALHILIRMYTRFPDVPEIQNAVGGLVQSCSAALTRDPTSIVNWITLSELSLLLGQRESALNCLEQLKRLGGENPDVAAQITHLKCRLTV